MHVLQQHILHFLSSTENSGEMTSEGKTTCCPVSDSPSEAMDSTVGAYFANLFDTTSYPARWNCGNWSSLEGWIHIGSDTAIFAAYFTIPAILIFFIRKQPKMPYRGLFLLFSAFIVSCGAEHALEAIIFYWPAYRLAGLLKLATAIISWFTVIAMILVAPKAFRLPGLAADNERLVRSDQAKTQFLANMSHEIRTPMAAILGYADLMLNSKENSDRQEYAQTIHRNGEHLLAVLNDVLDLSKIEAGRLDIETIAYDPRRVITDSVELQRIHAERKGLQLVGHFSAQFPSSILGDQVRLRQVLLNLLGNAVKFTESGVVELRGTVITLQDRPHIEIKITDSGIGMSAEQLKALFQPFLQADASTTRKYGGTGLGLAISQRLVELMGGTIEVSSVLGEGSTFRVVLPIECPEIDPAAGRDDQSASEDADSDTIRSQRAVEPVTRRVSRPAVQGDQPANESAPLSGLKVLLVEDGLDNRLLMGTLLRSAGATVDVSEHGGDAFKRLQGGMDPPDIILMDMQMPVMDGYQTTLRLREIGIEVPIVALTAHAMATDRAKCLAAGCSEYLSKPVRKEMLIETILSLTQPANSTSEVSPG